MPMTATTGADKAAGTTKLMSDKSAEMARSGAEMTRGMVDAGLRAASALRPNFDQAQKVAGAFGETQRETVRKSAEGSAALGKLYMDLLTEQAEHNLQAVKAFGKAFDWRELVELQREFVRASFQRMNELNTRYLELCRGVMTTAATTAKAGFKQAA